MARDIEEFLRKAAERRAAQQKGQRPVTPNLPGRPAPGTSRPVPAEDVIDLAEEPDPFPAGQSVAEHVRQHIDSGAAEISQHARQLGREVGESGQKTRQRIQQNLDHDLGQLSGGQAKGRDRSRQKQSQQSPSGQAAGSARTPLNLPPENAPPVITSVGLGQLLRSPQSIRQAIIVSELLKRPEWD